MAYVKETMECFPKPVKMGNYEIGPAPEVDHARCQGSWSPGTSNGEIIYGGWICPCPCHRNKQ